MNKQTAKRMFAFVLSAVMVLSCCVLTQGSKVSAENTGDARVYKTVDKAYFETMIDAKQAPTLEGYLFAGWVAEKEGKGTPIQAKTDKILSEEGVTVTAKFLKANLAGVACQVLTDTYDAQGNANLDETTIRVVSVVDNGMYQAFGYNLYERIKAKNGDTYTYFPWYSYEKDGIDNPTKSTVRYKGMNVKTAGGVETRTPADLFGADANDFYFTTVRMEAIPKAYFDRSIFVIQPYWVTYDGTYVEGLAEYNRIPDGKDGIVNISVNIKQAEAIAAGMLTVACPTGFTYAGADAGRMFEEMQVKEENGQIRCVGNVADMRKNAADPNEVYVNLRFTKTGTPAAGTSVFAVSGVDFCNKDEQTASVYIGDVRY